MSYDPRRWELRDGENLTGIGCVVVFFALVAAGLLAWIAAIALGMVLQ